MWFWNAYWLFKLNLKRCYDISTLVVLLSSMGEISRGGPSRLFLKVGSGRDLPSRLFSKVGSGRDWPSRSRDEKVGISRDKNPDLSRLFCPIYSNFRDKSRDKAREFGINQDKSRQIGQSRLSPNCLKISKSRVALPDPNPDLSKSQGGLPALDLDLTRPDFGRDFIPPRYLTHSWFL